MRDFAAVVRRFMTMRKMSLRETARGRVLGTHAAEQGAEWLPHVSVAYASADGPGEPIKAALEGMGGTETIVRAVDLIRLGRDERVYEWETVASLPLS